MRRGGRLLLVLGLLIAAGAAAFLFLFLQGNLGTGPAQDAANAVPTVIPEVDVVVARIEIPRGIVITDTETYLTTEPIGQDVFDANPDGYLRSPDEARDLLVVNTISRGNQITPNDLTEPGLAQQIPTAEADQPRPKAFPFQVNNLTGVADLLQPGDQVDILSSFLINRTVIGAGVGPNPTTQILEIQPQVQTFENQRSTKTIVQNVEVLRVIKPQAPPPDSTPTPEGEAPETDETGAVVDDSAETGQLQAGNWIVVLAVTDQEAELIKFSQEQGQRVLLVLRGSGDQETEQTTGVTLDLLVTRYGVPIPDPFASREFEALTPVPTFTPAPAP